MARATVYDISKLVDLHPNTLRRWTDRGLIEHKRDIFGRRWFPDPLQTIEDIKELLDGKKKGSGIER
jgi:DNA-binding transcriptional MerR regulator